MSEQQIKFTKFIQNTPRILELKYEEYLSNINFKLTQSIKKNNNRNDNISSQYNIDKNTKKLQKIKHTKTSLKYISYYKHQQYKHILTY